MIRWLFERTELDGRQACFEEPAHPCWHGEPLVEEPFFDGPRQLRRPDLG